MEFFENFPNDAVSTMVPRDYTLKKSLQIASHIGKVVAIRTRR
jgi:hypothetical protein